MATREPGKPFYAIKDKIFLFQIFDAGEYFSLGQEVDEETEEITWKAVVIKEEGIKNDDEKK